MSKQLDLFGNQNSSCNSVSRNLDMTDADVTIFEHFFDAKQSDSLFLALDQSIHWRQDNITIFGKTVPQPRLTAWHGDREKSYTYSGIAMNPSPWIEPLLKIKAKVEAVVGTTFNSVLLNKYRTGKDSVAWHSDDEPELGQNPVIASVSFGATRRFILKHKYDKSIDKVTIELTNGSLLLMSGSTQHFWVHQIPKTTKNVEPRINLTFRNIL